MRLPWIRRRLWQPPKRILLSEHQAVLGKLATDHDSITDELRREIGVLLASREGLRRNLDELRREMGTLLATRNALTRDLDELLKATLFNQYSEARRSQDYLGTLDGREWHMHPKWVSILNQALCADGQPLMNYGWMSDAIGPPDMILGIPVRVSASYQAPELSQP